MRVSDDNDTDIIKTKYIAVVALVDIHTHTYHNKIKHNANLYQITLLLLVLLCVVCASCRVDSR